MYELRRDHPFRGSISIGPEAFEDSYVYLMDGVLPTE